METYEQAAAQMMRLDRNDRAGFATSRRKAFAAFTRRFGGTDCGRTAKVVRKRGRAHVVVTDWVTGRVAEFDTSERRLRYVGETRLHTNR